MANTNLVISKYVNCNKKEGDVIISVATGITKVAKSPFTLHPHLLRKVVT